MNNRRKLLIVLGAGMLAAPFASLARAQPAKPARLGLLAPGSASGNERWVAALLANLRGMGYVEGRNLAIESRWAEGRNDRLPELAAELVRSRVDIIVALQTPAALAAKQATGTIPIVMAPAADPVATGLVASLGRPGGNVTGLSGAVSELAAKNLEIIREMLPSAARVGVLANAADSFTKSFVEQIQLAARTSGTELQTILVRGDERMDAAFEELAKARVSAVIVQPSLPRTLAIDLALKHRLPAAAPSLGFADAGGLMAYAANFEDLYREAASYVDKILRGAKPADLPIHQPSKFELVINLKTARRIGLKVPPGVLARADRVIE
jgi:putative ABC transport system substrate-binding protein